MSAQYASTVLALFDTRIATITSETPDGGFVKSAYRFDLEKEPDSAIDGLYYVDVMQIDPQNPQFGATETGWDAMIAVKVGYFRGGGDMDGGDRQTVTRAAADDMQKLADVLGNTAYYDGANTGVRRIIFRGAQRVQQTAAKDIWEARFFVNWRGSVITA